MPADKLASPADQMLEYLSQEHTSSKHALTSKVKIALNITPAPAEGRLHLPADAGSYLLSGSWLRYANRTKISGCQSDVYDFADTFLIADSVVAILVSQIQLAPIWPHQRRLGQARIDVGISARREPE